MFFISACTEQSGKVYLSKEASKPADPYQNPYDARSYPNRLEVFQGDKKICTVQSRGDLIDRWGFIDGGNYIAVRSSIHGKRTVLELFKTDTCKCADEIDLPASGSKKILPLWASSIFE